MLARNEDVDAMERSLRSWEQRFNHAWGYPVVFLNDEEWEAGVVERLNGVVSGRGEFGRVEEEMWGFPDWIDAARANESMAGQGAAGVLHADRPSYHHMCRFNSGMFYDHPLLRPYKWYWRIEPDVTFTCRIPYDPFAEMARRGKRYGYVMALWEIADTAPSLFRKVAEFKAKKRVETRAVWAAMVDPSYLPWPFRSWVAGWWRNRDDGGDAWSLCHFWSNFEIADMDFFRGELYRELFAFLDEAGGFYYERWGDAPVHSLAAAMLLEPEELHHFADFGYVHPPYQYCPFERKDGLVPSLADEPWQDLHQLGCDCECNTDFAFPQGVCLNRIRKTVIP